MLTLSERQRRTAAALDYRRRLAADAEFAASRLLRWLSDGEWWSRKRLLTVQSIKQAETLTAAVSVLIATGLVESRCTITGRRRWTYYRLKQ